MSAMEDASIRHETRWTTDRELLASILETLHALYLLTAQAHGAKNVGKPLRVTRPGDEHRQKSRGISPREFALQMRS